MSWMLSIWLAAALLALSQAENTVHEGNSLSTSGYYLCVRNETRIVTFLAMHKVPHTVTKPCGGWLLWKTCTVTDYKIIHQTEYKKVMEQVTRCCDGYVQVGSYCALPVNRSEEFTAKPGSCPTANGLYHGSVDCEWDMDCPGWQKCCRRSDRSLCSDPASSAYHSENGGYRFNATVTVKIDYEQLMSTDGGHLNHIRLLQAMVTGALESNVSVYYFSSWPVHPYRTATSMLIDCKFTLSLHSVTSKLHLLLKHIQEVSSVTVEDVDECAQPALRQCSPQADCNNTVGSYHCACHRGYIDVDPSYPGAQCTADVSVLTTAEPLVTYLPPMNTTYTPASNTTEDPQDSSTVGLFSSTETSMTPALSNTSSVPSKTSHAPQWTSSAAYSSMSTTVETPLPTTACSPPGITSLQSANVTGTSFCVYWSSQFQSNRTYLVVVSKGSEVVCSLETSQTMMEVRGLQPGVLYNVTVTPCACGSQGIPRHISVRTADVSVLTTAEPLVTYLPPMNTTYTPASNTTEDPQDSSTVGLFSSTETSMTPALSNTSSVPSKTSHAPQWTSSAAYSSMSTTVETPLPTTACSPSGITSLWSANVTGTSFCVYWSSQSQANQTYWVAVNKGSEVVCSLETSQTMMEVRGLQPGVLYNVTVTPRACGSRGTARHVSVRTDAQTLDATARLTNIQFTADLQNSSSQAYKNLTESIAKEIYESLSPEMKALIDAGQVRIEIRGFSSGSVVVDFTFIFTPSQSQDISNVTTSLLHSLTNSTKYTVDKNNTSISDFNECTSGENDCSKWAGCNNTWGSYTCFCLSGFIDNNPERPGRACRAIVSSETMTPISSTVSATPVSRITPATNDPSLLHASTAPGITTFIMSTSETASSTVPSTALVSATSSVAQTAVPVVTTFQTTTPALTTAATASTTTSAAPAATITTRMTTATAPSTTTTAPTTTPAGANTSTAKTTTTTAPTTTTTAPTIITTAPTTSTTAPTIITTAPTTTTTAPTTSTTAPTIITTAPTTTTTAPTTSTTAPTIITTAPTTSTTAPTIITTAPTIITTAPTTTTTAPTIITTAPTIITTAPTIITTAPTTTTTAPTTSTTAPTTTTTGPTITTSAPTSMTTAPSMTTTAPTTTSTAMTPLTRTHEASVTGPTTTITAPTTNATASRTATNASMQGAVSVKCRVAAITVTVARDFLQSTKIRESALYLGLPACVVNGGNATHAQLTVAWDECATKLVHNETHYIASATLLNSMDKYTSSSGTVEVPKIRLEVPIMCVYTKSALISGDFGSMGYDMIKDVIMGSGSFQVTLQLMNGTVPLPHNYTLPPDEAVVVSVSLNTSSEQIKVVITKCWATPTQSPVDTSSHIFLEYSCSMNEHTKVLMNGNSSTSQVSVKIFSFVNLNVIYLHCQVQICAQIGSDTCVPDCLQRTARSSKTIGIAFGSSGPLLKSDEESLEEEFNTLHIVGLSFLGIGLSLFFIIGFVCLFYYQRNRIGHYNFSAKPKQDNFTYLVFNT